MVKLVKIGVSKIKRMKNVEAITRRQQQVESDKQAAYFRH